MTIAIIDYGAGNLNSVLKAVRHVAGEMPNFSKEIQLVNTPDALASASHIILPGVGSFKGCMDGLKGLSNIIPALEQAVLKDKKPFLGICVGMQMLFELSEEHGNNEGLGWIKGKVSPITPTADQPLKVPHMGWNDLKLTNSNHPLFLDISKGDHAYFVHSYHCQPEDASSVLATVNYGSNIVASVAQDNIMATQFHPEKSQETGLTLLKNFLEV